MEEHGRGGVKYRGGSGREDGEVGLTGMGIVAREPNAGCNYCAERVEKGGNIVLRAGS